MSNKQMDNKNQKNTPGAPSGTHAQQGGKAATMPLKPPLQPSGGRPSPQDGGDKKGNSNTSRHVPDPAAVDIKPGKGGSNPGQQAGTKSPGHDDQGSGPKQSQHPGNNTGSKKPRIEGGTDEDLERDETGQPTGMMEDTRISNTINDEDVDTDRDDSTDEVKRSDRAKNANGGSNKPR